MKSKYVDETVRIVKIFLRRMWDDFLKGETKDWDESEKEYLFHARKMISAFLEKERHKRITRIINFLKKELVSRKFFLILVVLVVFWLGVVIDWFFLVWREILGGAITLSLAIGLWYLFKSFEKDHVKKNENLIGGENE